MSQQGTSLSRRVRTIPSSEGEARSTRWRRQPLAVVAANDNGPATGRSDVADFEIDGRASGCVTPDDDIFASAAPVCVAANDNDEYVVTDDLPRPVPVVPGEADLVRKLLGERFRQILLQGENP
jgi:hypothetical protein